MQDDVPALLAVSRVVNAGHEDEFRHWSDRLGKAVSGAAGHCGEVRLEQSGGLFHLLHQFDSPDALARWEASDSYGELMKEGDRFSNPRRQRVNGRHPTVHLPADGDSPKWKRFLMTWLAVLPVVIGINLLLNQLPAKLPPAVQAAVSSMLLVACMTWFILPFVSRRLKPWTLKDGSGQARVAS